MVSQYARVVFRGSPTVTRRIPFEESVRTLTVLWATSLGLTVPISLLDEHAPLAKPGSSRKNVAGN
jgi:hypothetical protein